ncbi:hypothetical protein CPB85DRAFT_1443380 [Mucidula mucida]|nr:hypothetical protein CPB85DRAFT_1443380 [Mucidula mucida]
MHREKFSFTEADVYIGNPQAQRVIFGFIDQRRENSSLGRNEMGKDLLTLSSNGMASFWRLLFWSVGYGLWRIFGAPRWDAHMLASARHLSWPLECAHWIKHNLLGHVNPPSGCCDVKLQNPSLYGPHISLRMEHLDK